MTIIQTGGLAPNSLSGFASQQVYNGLDCCVTVEVWEEVMAQYGQPPAIYNFERALQGPYLEIMQRGFLVDDLSRRKASEELRTRMEHLLSLLNEFSLAVWDKPLNPRSPKQLQEFFYSKMRLPEIWISQKGERKLSTNREVLEKLWEYMYARPFVNIILAYREAAKQLEVFETEIDADGRFRTSYNIAGTETGRPSSSESAFGTGCVRPSAEALTPTGWKSLSEIADGDLIMQWEHGNLSMVPCTVHRGVFEGKLLRCSGEQMDLTMTPNHRVLFHTDKNRENRVQQAQTVSLKTQTYIPLSGWIATDGQLNYPAYLAMLMADFSHEDYGWRATFHKERKIERFLSHAMNYELEWTEQKSYPGSRRFRVSGHDDLPKKWGPWVLNLSRQSAVDLVAEARYWDSHDRGSGFQFCTADKEQAQWFATLVHLVGRGATIQRKERNAGSYSTTTMYIVNVKDRGRAQIMRKHWSEVEYSGEICCPQVPSSFWLVRENGKISVTGNSNAQNISPALRYVFVADPGMKMCVIDLEQVEARDVGFFCGCLFGDWRFLDACEGGDLHTANARLIWPELPWTGDITKDKIIAGGNFYRDFSYRDMAKRGSHLSNYYGTAWTAARSLKVPIAIMEEFQARYIRGGRVNGQLVEPAYPCIPQWWRWTAEQLQTTNQLLTPFGRRRHFFGRPNDDTTLREAIAFLPQSTTADRMNLGLWRVWKNMPEVQLLAQTYDSITFQYPEALDEDEIVSKALELIRVELVAPNGRSYVVPGEAKVGWNWGYQYTAEDAEKAVAKGQKPARLNPGGLAKWKLGKRDSRVRELGIKRTIS